ncbi:MAG: hypothetical protein HC912_07595, partial [Saprospiraceae bacterium]|nr:hypothetical protein [Saprospiraceae bacterium]
NFYQNFPTFSQVAQELLQWLKNLELQKYFWISHGCDSKTLAKEFEREKLKLPTNYIWIDSGKLVRTFLNTPYWGVDSLCSRFDIIRINPHTVLGDIWTQWILIQKVINISTKKNPIQVFVEFSNQNSISVRQYK